MKFYNPFKPHIVKDGNGEYFIRVREIGFGWQFYSDIGDYFFGKSDAESFDSYEEAHKNLISYECRVHNQKLRQKARNTLKVVHAPED